MLEEEEEMEDDVEGEEEEEFPYKKAPAIRSLSDLWKHREEWNRFVALLDAAEGEGEDSEGKKLGLSRYAR